MHISVKKAFTLLELLVAIVIIAIIAALFFPALGKARESARSALCLNNLRQIGIAWHMYLSDHNDCFPPWSTPNTGGCDWFTYGGKAGTYGGYSYNASVRPLNRYFDIFSEADKQALEIFHCPADIKSTAIFSGTGRAFDVWGNSYLTNMFILQYKPNGVNFAPRPLSTLSTSPSVLGLTWDFHARNPGHGGIGSSTMKTTVLFLDGHLGTHKWMNDWGTEKLRER